MRIGGLQKLSLVDYPGKIAATVFTQGCHFRCGFCHNPELVLPQLFGQPLPAVTILEYLNLRRGKLEGVVISGGEPTIQEGLADFIAQIKALGFCVKLDTNGINPHVIASLVKSSLIDYIAMDVKTSRGKYAQLVGSACDINKILESIHIIINSGLPYQLRTTLIRGFCSEEDLRDIQQMIEGANHYVLQPFVSSGNIVDPQFEGCHPPSDEEIGAFRAKYERLMKKI